LSGHLDIIVHLRAASQQIRSAIRTATPFATCSKITE